jgi:hypothetical protein
MILELYRKCVFSDRIIGDLYVDGHWECFTLEDQDRRLEDYLDTPDIKVYGKTAIPRGKYRVDIDMSARFKSLMPHLLDVPLFTGIRIHVGNTPQDVEGCIIVGKSVDWDTRTLLHSRLAFSEFFPKLSWGLAQGQVWITII